jgi:hypothetical protein
MSSEWTFKDFTLAPKKALDGHEKAVNHFAENLSADYKNYMPPKGYRHKRFKNYQPYEVPKVGATMSYKGEFVTVLAKDKAHFAGSGVKVVNVLYVSWGKDPNTKTAPRFTWENWDKQTGFKRRKK